MTSYEESDLPPNFFPRATQPTEEHACRLLRRCRISLERLRSHKEIGKLRKASPNLCQTVSYQFPFEALRHKAMLRTWQHNSSRTMAKKKKNAELLHACWMTCSWLYWLINFFHHRQPNKIYNVIKL